MSGLAISSGWLNSCLLLAPAMKVLLYCDVGVTWVLIMLRCLCVVGSVRKLR